MEEKDQNSPTYRLPSPSALTGEGLWLENLPAGVFLVSPQGRIVKMNAAVRTFAPAEGKKMMGQSYHTLFQSLSNIAQKPEVVREGLYAAQQALPELTRVDLKVDGDPDRFLQISLFTVRDAGDHGIQWGGLIHEPSQRESHRDQTGVYAIELEKKSRKQLASIQGQLRALADHHLDWDAEMVDDVLQTLHKELNEVVGQVERTIQILRFQNEGVVVYPEEVSLEEMVQSLVSNQPAGEPYPSLHFEYDQDLPPLRVDPQQVEDVFQEVLRYMADRLGSDSDVTVKAHDLAGEVKVSVSGRWIGEENKGSPTFVAEKNEVDPLNGPLLMSKEIILAHGGNIWVDDVELDGKRGIEISLTLPLMPQQRSVRMKAMESSDEDQTTGTILIAEPDPETLHLLTSVLREKGNKVQVASDGPSVVDVVQASTPDLVILEWDLPGMNGLGVSKYIRRWSSTPLFMLSSRTNPENLIEAFEAGVDDYLTKPFLVEEVLARVKALLRRSGEGLAEVKTEVFERHGLRINFDTQRVWLRGEPLDLTPLEYKILTYMAQHRRQVLPYQQLIEHVWDAPDKGSRRGLFVHISRLRQKLERNPEDPEFIVNRWGVGYAFLPD
jgi:DNA-binding response OmpR family regulator/nitrogen-specific signal transduction histidine kinase